MQLLIFRFPQQQLGFWAFVATPLIPFGGLKWTRTIDLTLIRRVL